MCGAPVPNTSVVASTTDIQFVLRTKHLLYSVVVSCHAKQNKKFGLHDNEFIPSSHKFS